MGAVISARKYDSHNEGAHDKREEVTEHSQYNKNEYKQGEHDPCRQF